MEWLKKGIAGKTIPFVHVIKYCRNPEKSSEVPFSCRIVYRRFIFFSVTP